MSPGLEDAPRPIVAEKSAFSHRHDNYPGADRGSSEKTAHCAPSVCVGTHDREKGGLAAGAEGNGERREERTHACAWECVSIKSADFLRPSAGLSASKSNIKHGQRFSVRMSWTF